MTATARDHEEWAQSDGVRPPALAQQVPRPPRPATGSTLPAPRSRCAPIDPERLDSVIQRLFPAGILLRDTSQESIPGLVASIAQAVGELEDALRDIRAAVLER